MLVKAIGRPGRGEKNLGLHAWRKKPKMLARDVYGAAHP
jgi:hypothetical protein